MSRVGLRYVLLWLSVLGFVAYVSVPDYSKLWNGVTATVCISWDTKRLISIRSTMLVIKLGGGAFLLVYG